MDTVRILYFVLFFINICSFSIRLFCSLKRKDNTNSKKLYDKKNKSSNTVFDAVLSLIANICLIALFVHSYSNNLMPFNNIIKLFYSTIIFSYVLYVLKAFVTLKSIIFDDNDDNGELTYKETEAFYIVLCSVLFFKSLLPINELFVALESLQVNAYLIDLIYSILILLYFFVFTFTIIVLLIQPIKDLRRVFIYIASKIVPKIRVIKESLRHILLDNSLKAEFSNYVISLHNSYNGFKRYIILVLLIETVFIDFGLIMFNSIVSFMVFSLLVSLELLKLFTRILRRLVVFISYIPGKRIMIKSFRLSGIISLALLVISNRINWLHVYSETYIGISEFIASAIIIPLVFEWISSYKGKKATK